MSALRGHTRACRWLRGFALVGALALGAACGNVANGNDPTAFVSKHRRSARANLSKSLYDDTDAAQAFPDILHEFRDDQHHTATGGISTTGAAAELFRFSCDTSGRKSIPRTVFVENPAHDPCVRVHIGRGYILHGAEYVVEIRDILSRHALQFAIRHPERIAVDAALGASERDIQ